MNQSVDTTRLAAARLVATDLQPYTALALYALTPVATPGLGTFAVDRAWRLYIDPAALERWTIAEVAGVLLHEVGHVVRDHAGRASGIGVAEASAERWNVAADAELNDDLVADGVALPPIPVTPGRLHLDGGRAAEWYYHQLRDREDLPVVADCGSGCHGIDPPADRLGIGDGVLPTGLSDADAHLLRRRVAVAVLEHAARQPGAVPGGWTRWAEATLHPTIAWQRLLRSEIRSAVAATAGQTDYSYRKPPRRQVHRVVLPSMQRPVPRVAVVIDTSGSVDDAQLAAAWTEVRGCLRSLAVRRDLLSIYATDAAVHHLNSFGRHVPLTGGGGTDLRIGINAAAAVRPPVDVIVVLTDGLTPWPDRPPRARMVIGLLQDPTALPVATPTWAKTVTVPVVEDRRRMSARTVEVSTS